MNKLSSYSHRVSESRDVIAASEFARWLNFSGLIPLFNANPQDAPFKVDGALLQWAVNDLIERCNDRFRTNSSDPKMSVDEYESLHDKVDKMMSNQDTIAGYLAKLFGSSVRSAEDASAMILISGGLDGRLPASGEADEPALVKSRVA
jgi:asparagine synthetase B (glutamine-hydrolysing)